jgi:hypothetical protein
MITINHADVVIILEPEGKVRLTKAPPALIEVLESRIREHRDRSLRGGWCRAAFRTEFLKQAVHITEIIQAKGTHAGYVVAVADEVTWTEDPVIGITYCDFFAVTQSVSGNFTHDVENALAAAYGACNYGCSMINCKKGGHSWTWRLLRCRGNQNTIPLKERVRKPD